MPEADVGRLVFGTAAIGLAYGLPGPDGRRERIDDDDARDLIVTALGEGISTFDTAPAYGEAESRLGRALGGRGRVWTKVSGTDAARSVDTSLARLGRDQVELVSWHNWTRSLVGDGSFRATWDGLRTHPGVGARGATTYGPDDACAAAESGTFDVVQVEWNLLRQGVLPRLRAVAAASAGVSIAIRSVWLQGVLTPRSESLPMALRALLPTVERAAALAHAWELSLEALALRAALDQPGVDFVLVGLDSHAQLAAALDAARAPRLEPDQLAALAALDRGDDPLTDPRRWPAV